VQVKEDPDSLALRARLAAAEEKLAAAAEAMNATQKVLVQALTAPPAPAAAVTDAELWHGFAQAALGGILAAPATWGLSPAAFAAECAGELLAAYRARFPT
jgi:hypothetical protein